jgi:hypothetical protein
VNRFNADRQKSMFFRPRMAEPAPMADRRDPSARAPIVVCGTGTSWTWTSTWAGGGAPNQRSARAAVGLRINQSLARAGCARRERRRRGRLGTRRGLENAIARRHAGRVARLRPPPYASARYGEGEHAVGEYIRLAEDPGAIANAASDASARQKRWH